MKKDDRVVMIRSDGFGSEGNIGTIFDQNPMGSNSVVRVNWDNGKSYLHDIRDLRPLDQLENDPNLAFLMKKRG